MTVYTRKLTRRERQRLGTLGLIRWVGWGRGASGRTIRVHGITRRGAEFAIRQAIEDSNRAWASTRHHP